jgi:UDP-glucose:glycoprotein glucosyltransferase
LVRSEFDELLASEPPSQEGASVTLDIIINDHGVSSAPLNKIQAYTERLGATLGTPEGHAFVNGKHFKLDDVGGS